MAVTVPGPVDVRPGPDEWAATDFGLRVLNGPAISVLDGRRMTTLGSPRLAALIGRQIELAYSRIDADGSLREVRISAVDG